MAKLGGGRPARVMTRDRRQDEAGGGERGTAMIVTVLVLFMLMALAMSIAGTTASNSNLAMHARDRVKLLAAAEAGIGLKHNEINYSAASAESFVEREWTLPDGIKVRAWGQGFDQDGNIDDSGEADLVRVRAVAKDPQGNERGIEVYLAPEITPAFRNAIYVGNRAGLADYTLQLGPVNRGFAEPDEDDPFKSPYGTHDPDEIDKFSPSSGSGWAWRGDAVNGSVFVNGDAQLRGDTNVWGSVSATGTVDGNPVTGGVHEQQPALEAPDLSQIDYKGLAQTNGFMITSTKDSWSSGQKGAATHVNFIHEGLLQKGTQTDDTTYGRHPEKFDHPNFVLGKNGSSMKTTTILDTSQITTEKNVVYVKGNLWVGSAFVMTYQTPSSGNGTQVTVVVEGNMYISDELNYKNVNDAFLFIVKAPEDDPNTPEPEDQSYIDGYDANGNRLSSDKINGVYDPEEAIIDGNGNILGSKALGARLEDGTFAGPGTIDYQGPKEGSGNIYWGDRIQTAGGITDGYMYAQNNAYLFPGNTPKQVYGVRGFFNAGGVLDLGDENVHRSYEESNNKFVNYRVAFDPRLGGGALPNMRGIPAAQGGGFLGLSVASWRELQPHEWE